MTKTKNTRMIAPGYALLILLPNLAALKSEPFHARAATEQISHYSASSAGRFFSLNDSLNEATTGTTSAAPSIQWNANAMAAARNLLKRESVALNAVKKRSHSYFATIDKVFSQYDLPLQLKYLAVVESDLNPRATSRMGAKGVWQFMPGTARELGLKVNGSVDERTHFYKSTVAAAKYLRQLYRYFDDWLLVIAAYNSGPGGVFNAIKKSGSRNFWVLQHHLPAESRAHVKRFIGTHYFFEQEGSVTILTKTEARAHAAAVEEYLAALEAKSEEEEDIAVATTQ